MKENSKRTSLIVGLIITFGLLVWQVYRLIDSDLTGSVSAPVHAMTSQNPSNLPPNPTHKPTHAAWKQTVLPTESEQSYLDLAAQIQRAKMKNRLLQEQVAIAQAEKKLVEARQAVQGMGVFKGRQSNQWSSRGPEGQAALHLVYLLQRENKEWEATLRQGNRYFHVRRDMTVGEGRRVAAVVSRGVWIQDNRGVHWFGFPGESAPKGAAAAQQRPLAHKHVVHHNKIKKQVRHKATVLRLLDQPTPRQVNAMPKKGQLARISKKPGMKKRALLNKQKQVLPQKTRFESRKNTDKQPNQTVKRIGSMPASSGLEKSHKHTPTQSHDGTSKQVNSVQVPQPRSVATKGVHVPAPSASHPSISAVEIHKDHTHHAPTRKPEQLKRAGLVRGPAAPSTPVPHKFNRTKAHARPLPSPKASSQEKTQDRIRKEAPHRRDSPATKHAIKPSGPTEVSQNRVTQVEKIGPLLSAKPSAICLKRSYCAVKHSMPLKRSTPAAVSTKKTISLAHSQSTHKKNLHIPGLEWLTLV